jgi:hypothetical protein
MPYFRQKFEVAFNLLPMGNLLYSSSSSSDESPQTDCLTSNATLFWRVFVPIFGTVFLGGLTLAMMLISAENLLLPFPALWGRLGALLLLSAWIFLIKSTIWRLKRVDATEKHLFVTNYWHTVRYPWSDVLKVEETRRAGRRLIHLHLVAPGKFGQVISILPAAHFDTMLEGLKVKRN